jgi:hypothetical protein
VVEITPIGIASVGWWFYIIWTVFNFAFVPIVYFLYPETAGRSRMALYTTPPIVVHSLIEPAIVEDIDRFFIENQHVLIFRYAEARSSKRPERYSAQECEEIRRNSSIVTSEIETVLSGRTLA